MRGLGLGLSMTRGGGAETLGSEIITNGTFAANVTGWAPSGGAGTTAWDSGGGGRLKHTIGAAFPDAAEQQQFGVLTNGARYRLRATLIPGNTADKAKLQFNAGFSDSFAYDTHGGTINQVITATGVNLFIDLFPANSTTAGSVGDFAYFDDISLKQIL